MTERSQHELVLVAALTAILSELGGDFTLTKADLQAADALNLTMHPLADGGVLFVVKSTATAPVALVEESAEGAGVPILGHIDL
jgi:hypothetical protein